MQSVFKSKYNTAFYSFIIVLMIFIVLGIVTESIFLWFIPVVLAFSFYIFKDIRWLLYLFFLVLPFTIEYYLPNGMGIDIPGEPVLIIITFFTFIFIAARYSKLDLKYLKNPITIILLIHLTWILFTTLFANNSIISFKFFLAKLWYVIPMYFLPIMVLEKDNLKPVLRNLLLISTFMVIFVLAKHSLTYFDFSTVSGAVSPFFRNHVSYASLITIIFPFWFLLLHWYKNRFSKFLIYTGIILFIAGIFLSYTRAAHIALLSMIFVYFIIKYRLIKYVLILSTISIVFLFGYILSDNKYLDLAPDYNKTITYDDFDDIVNATYQGTDLSTMERLYRWVSGYNMIQERPLTGFGPGNFYSSYRPYTVTSFTTYVSDNPEKSGIHSYYLMTLVDQGFPGLLIFLALVFYSLIHGEYLYHRLKDPELKRILIAVMLSIVSIYLILLINDMIESIKTGTIFFFDLALLILIGKWGKVAEQNKG
ncbi:MAG TPA: O-antigen ligase family protein [Bacteroidetes bacterium]|nr:O-antigen ligase family protein [Bacteroidota bacterium]